MTERNNQQQRRKFLKEFGAAGALAFIGLPIVYSVTNNKDRKSFHSHVVIIGAGFGGATCAKYLRKLDGSIKVTLIDANTQYTSCPLSNTVLAGMNTVEKLRFGYDALQEKYGINFINDTISTIDHDKKNVRLSDGTRLAYDRLVVAPGVSFTWNSPDAYDEAASKVMPHAWKAGAQTSLLREQLLAMDDGGVVAIAPPAKPFRCPPGPYERAGMIASYLTAHKPKSKILILDSNESFSKQALFFQGWEQRYKEMIEWVPVTEGGAVQAVDTKSMTLITDLDEHHVDVANVIPAQTAGKLAVDNGLTNASGWCPINQKTFESTLVEGVHVLGDAALAGSMPKSASAANSQAKTCALAISALLIGDEPNNPSFHNTCYSLIDEDYGISVSAIYSLTDNAIQKVEGSGGVSPIDVDQQFRADEAKYARGWFDSITLDTFS